MTSKLKWLAVVLFTSAVVGGGGVGVYVASAQEKAKPADAKAPAGDKKPPADKPGELKAEGVAAAKTADDVQKALKAELSLPEEGMKLGDVFEMIQKEHGLNIRLDTTSFRRRGWGEGVPEYEDVQKGIYNIPVRGSGLKRVPVEDALRELLAQVRGSGNAGPHLLSYRIKGNTILIVPEYRPASLPGSGASGVEVVSPDVPVNQLLEDLYGEPVTVRYKKKPLAEVIEDLQDRTGANIVLNVNRLGGDVDVDKLLVTANFNDVRLLTVLKVVGDMHGLKPVVIDNVFYLTDAASAEEMQREVNRDLFGTPPTKPEAKK